MPRSRPGRDSAEARDRQHQHDGQGELGSGVPGRCDVTRDEQHGKPAAGSSPAGSRTPAACSSSSAADRHRRHRERERNPADQERGHREPRALYQGAGPAAPLSDRSHAPAAGKPACFPRRGVVHLDLHVLPGECEVHAARPVAAVQTETAVRQAEGHRIGSPRQPAQALQSAGPGVRADRRVVRARIADACTWREVAEVDVSIRGPSQLVRVVLQLPGPIDRVPCPIRKRAELGDRRGGRFRAIRTRAVPPACRTNQTPKARARVTATTAPGDLACGCRSLGGDPGWLGSRRELGRGVH